MEEPETFGEVEFPNSSRYEFFLNFFYTFFLFSLTDCCGSGS